MINKIIVCFVIGLGILSASSFAEEIVKVISYLEVISYEDSLLVAKNQNKKVLLFFSADYCGWCHKQKEIILDPEVAENLSDYIVCYVDTVERKDLSTKYKVRSIPSYFVVDSDENIIKKNTGYKDKTDFIKWLKK